MQALVSDNLTALRQGEDLLVELTDVAYAAPVAAVFGASVGAHFRHILDHYLAFFRGWPVAAVDYEARERDPGLEARRERAVEVLRGIVQQFASWEAMSPSDRPLKVREEADDVAAAATWVASSARRELQFLLSHTVHHYALIAVQCRLLGVEPGRNFGVAPSTLRHRRAVSLAG